ncbi:hypothetical protein [Citrobacter sp. CF971]|uniref:hypothetical protein n=1 Tax=Citrobacter sp. CF971 TaxID=2566012 RepID=UPI0011237EC4|nr:hypothetical protein [Citrobacter sp. CF971]QDE45482.1 hypothetical protein E6P06_20740 [Citrobacter sp. CF971]
MKITKFGTVFVDEDGDIVIKNFNLETESDDEMFDKEVHALNAIIKFMVDKRNLSGGKETSTDIDSDFIVLRAIEKARLSK